MYVEAGENVVRRQVPCVIMRYNGWGIRDGVKRGLKAEERIGQVDSEVVCNVRCMGSSVICRVWVTSVRVRSGQIVHEQQSVRKKYNTRTTVSDKELGTVRRKRQQTGALATKESVLDPTSGMYLHFLHLE